MGIIRRKAHDQKNATRSLRLCRPGPAPLLALVFSIGALGQHGSAARGMLTGQIRPVAPSPYSIPFLNPFFSFPGRLAATVSGSWFGAPPFWGAGLAPTIPPFACPTSFARCFVTHGSRNSRSFTGWGSSQGYGAPDFYPYPLSPNLSMPGSNSPPPDFLAGLVPVPESPNSMLPPDAVSHGEGQRVRDTESTPNFQEVTSPGRSIGETQKAGSSGSCTDPVPNSEHPTLLALKNGWAYTVLKSWITGKTLHFITTQGDHQAVPISQLDRMYPKSAQAVKLPITSR